jgi:hypothetical protein
VDTLKQVYGDYYAEAHHFCDIRLLRASYTLSDLDSAVLTSLSVKLGQGYFSVT